MKNYYIYATLNDYMPCYDFVIKAKTLESAKNKAEKILKTDYPEQWNDRHGIDYTCREITAEGLLKALTLN
jgi:hypothetical protein